MRWLSATHQDLARCVAEGHFREDLFYRINVIEVRVPPLRERREDLPLLAAHFLARIAADQDRAPPSLAADALAALQRHSFPGNVRELENLLERAMTLGEGPELAAADLQLRKPPAPAGSDDTPLAGQLQDLERQSILGALEQTRGNRTAAAEVLGMTFRQLRYRIKKLGLDRGG